MLLHFKGEKVVSQRKRGKEGRKKVTASKDYTANHTKEIWLRRVDNDETRPGKMRQEKRPRRESHQRGHPAAQPPGAPVPGVPKSQSSCTKTWANGMRGLQPPHGKRALGGAGRVPRDASL